MGLTTLLAVVWYGVLFNINLAACHGFAFGQSSTHGKRLSYQSNDQRTRTHAGMPALRSLLSQPLPT
jgi:hypothetical protein